jgi:methylmalonyl-CoA mutase N-terminal domain/subunit
VDQKEQIVVGVNEFTASETTSLRLLKVDPAVREQQMARLAALRQWRDNGRVHTLLAKLEQTALRQVNPELSRRAQDAAGACPEPGRRDENLLPVILECVESYATLGEICGALRCVFGEYKPTVAL